MTDRELLELIAEKVVKMDDRIDRMENRMDRIEGKMDQMEGGLNGRMDRMEGNLNGRMDQMEGELNGRMDRMVGSIVRMEHDHGHKLAALFDGYKQNSDKLDRIEAEVTKHDKFILERIK